MRNAVKLIARRILPDSDRLRYIAYKPKFWSWQAKQYDNYPRFRSRTEVYDYINQDILSNKAIHYLEFGVFRGESIAYWADINLNSNSRFYGFDSFTGLPEDWDTSHRILKRGTFDTGGKVPEPGDERVHFVKGLFQDTLPRFLQEYTIEDQLVIHNDSDLYSSTLFVLSCANHIIVPGTIIIFDQFRHVLHEFRALEDYCSSFRRDYEVLAATLNHGRLAIRVR
jgi:hypothetical protein